MATREQWEAMRAQPHYANILKDRPYSTIDEPLPHLPVYSHISASLQDMIDARRPKQVEPLAGMEEFLGLQRSLSQARDFARFIRDNYDVSPPPQRPQRPTRPQPQPQPQPQPRPPVFAHHFINPPATPPQTRFPGRGRRLGGRPGARRLPTSQTGELRVD